MPTIGGKGHVRRKDGIAILFLFFFSAQLPSLGNSDGLRILCVDGMLVYIKSVRIRLDGITLSF